MRGFLLITNIDKIDIHIIGINKYFIYFGIYLIYLIYPYFVFYFGQKYFNILKDVLCIKKLALDLPIMLNKSVMT